jgi:hypothetical protein
MKKLLLIFGAMLPSTCLVYGASDPPCVLWLGNHKLTFNDRLSAEQQKALFAKALDQATDDFARTHPSPTDQLEYSMKLMSDFADYTECLVREEDAKSRQNGPRR